MSLLSDLALTSATYTGNAHTLHGRGNQDAVRVSRSSKAIVAVVTDGCGSCLHSEYGARFAANFLANRAGLLLDTSDSQVLDWNSLTVAYLTAVEHHMFSVLGVPREEFTKFLDDHFMHTTVVAVITEDQATFARCGDSHITVNGRSYPSPEYPGNAPPFLAYRLYSAPQRKQLGWTDNELGFDVVVTLPTAELTSFVIGSDGVNRIVQHANHLLPGRKAKVGGLEQFWTNPVYRSGERLAMRLQLIGRSYPGSVRRLAVDGHLDDDTTLVVGVRTPRASEEQTGETIHE